MRFHIGNTKLHADSPHETLTFLEDSKNALSARMFNIFLCFSVFHIHTELISSQYMPGSRMIQPLEKGLRLRRKVHGRQLFPSGSPFIPVDTEPPRHGKNLSTGVLTGAVRSRGKLFPAIILPYPSSHARSISKAGPRNPMGDAPRRRPSARRRPTRAAAFLPGVQWDFPRTRAIKNPASLREAGSERMPQGRSFAGRPSKIPRWGTKIRSLGWMGIPLSRMEK